MFETLIPRWRGGRFGAAGFLFVLPLVLASGLLSAPHTRAADTLAEALNLALANPSLVPHENLSATDQSASAEDAGQWLGGLPVLSLSYLGSDKWAGTDETEISLSFPVKSPLQRRSDATLDQVDPQLDNAAERYRAWYLSGTLRELFARDQRARVELPAVEAGVDLLAQMEAQLRQRLSAGSAERFDLIAVQQQRLQLESRFASLRADRLAAGRLYAGLTGETSLPATSGDDRALPGQPLYARHPNLELLDLNIQREIAALRASSNGAAPWNVAVVGRELSIPTFRERLYGVAINVPISLGAKPSPATLSSERSLRRDYQIQRDNVLMSLRSNWETLLAERQTLQAQQARLAEALNPVSVEQLINQTKDSRELPVELRIQRMLALLDAQARPALLAARLEANAAALRQLAGLGL